MYFTTLEKSGSNKDLVNIVCWDFQETFPTRKGDFWKRKESWTAGFLATGYYRCYVCGLQDWSDEFMRVQRHKPQFRKSLATFFMWGKCSRKLLLHFHWFSWPFFISHCWMLIENFRVCLFSNPECSCMGAVPHMEISRKCGHWSFQMAYLGVR